MPNESLQLKRSSQEVSPTKKDGEVAKPIEQEGVQVAQDFQTETIQAKLKERKAELEQNERDLEFQKRMERGHKPTGNTEAMQGLIDIAKAEISELEEELKDPKAYAKKKEEKLRQGIIRRQELEEEGRQEAKERQEKTDRFKKAIEGVNNFEELYNVLKSLDEREGPYIVENIQIAVEMAKKNGLDDISPDSNIDIAYIRKDQIDFGNALYNKVNDLYHKSKKSWYKPWTWSK